ncbi:hypothetical protein HK100_001838 [Physocladia obscura]|uniref:Uncharacterized protein n=1 Tax=Physocladia obscura TaxID=109957 RepID=A0AAD5SW79_9FUNG|nr:hypothetical protein HK100_001838 [Physocladia obscura]
MSSIFSSVASTVATTAATKASTNTVPSTSATVTVPGILSSISSLTTSISVKAVSSISGTSSISSLTTVTTVLTNSESTEIDSTTSATSTYTSLFLESSSDNGSGAGMYVLIVIAVIVGFLAAWCGILWWRRSVRKRKEFEEKRIQVLPWMQPAKRASIPVGSNSSGQIGESNSSTRIMSVRKNSRAELTGSLYDHREPLPPRIITVQGEVDEILQARMRQNQIDMEITPLLTPTECVQLVQRRYSSHLALVLPTFNTNRKDASGVSPAEAIANDMPAQAMLQALLDELSPTSHTSETRNSKSLRQSSFKLARKLSGDLRDIMSLDDLPPLPQIPRELLTTHIMSEPQEAGKEEFQKNQKQLDLVQKKQSDKLTNLPSLPSKTQTMASQSLRYQNDAFGKISTDNSLPHKSNPSKEEAVLGDYLLQKTIGEGCFSKVKMGIHFPTNQKVTKDNDNRSNDN